MTAIFIITSNNKAPQSLNRSRARKIASPTSRGYCVFQSGYQNLSLPCPTGYLKIQGSRRSLKTLQISCIKLKAIKSFKYVKWYKKCLNYNFKRSYSWGWKDKNGDTAGLNFKRQWCHWINMSTARFKSKHGTDVFMWMYLKGTDCPQKCVIGIFISSYL